MSCCELCESVEGRPINELVTQSLSNRNLGFDDVVIGADVLARSVKQPSGGQSLYVSMQITVITPEGLREGANARDLNFPRLTTCYIVET